MKPIRKQLYNDHDIYGGFEPHELQLQGWNSDSPCFNEYISELKPDLIIEVGSWKGCSAIYMAGVCKELGLNTEIICIDTWLGSVEHWGSSCVSILKNGRPMLYEKFLSNVILSDATDYITPMPIDSVNGALVLERRNIKADIIYIDAGHEYDSVFADFTNFKKLVRPGGIIIGDDWHHQPIKDAAEKVFGTVETIKDNKFLWRNV